MLDRNSNPQLISGRSEDVFKTLNPNAVVDFDLLTEDIMHVLTDVLHYKIPSVTMYDKEMDGLRIMKYWLPKPVEIIVQKTLGKSIERIVFSISDEENLFVKVYKNKAIEIRNSVEDLCRPYLSRFISHQIDAILNVKMVAVVPIIVSGETIGTFAFGSDFAQALSRTEQDLLINMAQQIGAYLLSAWLLRSAILQNKALKERNEKLENLLQIKQALLNNLVSFFQVFSLQEHSEMIKQRLNGYTSYIKSLNLVSDSKTKDDLLKKD